MALLLRFHPSQTTPDVRQESYSYLDRILGDACRKSTSQALGIHIVPRGGAEQAVHSELQNNHDFSQKRCRGSHAPFPARDEITIGFLPYLLLTVLVHIANSAVN